MRMNRWGQWRLLCDSTGMTAKPSEAYLIAKKGRQKPPRGRGVMTMPNKPPPKPDRATIYVRPEVKKRLKAISGLRGISIGQLVAELLQEYQARK